jgi:autophagy-related protein 2
MGRPFCVCSDQYFCRFNIKALPASVEDLAFKVIPEIGPSGDLIQDDLPTNLDYLDESFGSAAGLRELRDEDLDEFDDDDERGTQGIDDDPSTVSKIGGETIKIFESDGLEAVEGYFLSIPPDTSQGLSQ